MKLAVPYFNTVLTFQENIITTLVIENPVCWREVLTDLNRQAAGETGEAVLSRNNTPVPFSKNAELLTQFTPFDMNRKSLLTKMIAALEKKGAEPECYMAVQEYLRETEMLFLRLAEDLPTELGFEKLTLGNLLKAASPFMEPQSDEPLGQLLDYMAAVTRLEGEKLFITVGIRPCFSTDELEPFAETVLAHKYKLLMVDAYSFPRLKQENRLTVDKDRCEF